MWDRSSKKISTFLLLTLPFLAVSADDGAAKGGPRTKPRPLAAKRVPQVNSTNGLAGEPPARTGPSSPASSRSPRKASNSALPKAPDLSGVRKASVASVAKTPRYTTPTLKNTLEARRAWPRGAARLAQNGEPNPTGKSNCPNGQCPKRP